jgi:hypothetical protein
VGIVFGHLSCAFHESIQRSTSDQPGSANLDTLYATFPHHSPNMFNVVIELFGSLFCGDKLV